MSIESATDLAGMELAGRAVGDPKTVTLKDGWTIRTRDRSLAALERERDFLPHNSLKHLTPASTQNLGVSSSRGLIALR